MRIFLVWTLFLMRATSTGPRQVTVEQGSSLALSCSYKPRYKLSFKYWSRKSSLMTSMIQTDGSEVTVTRDRVSIRDNHTANSFTVTLSSVTAGDAGRYSCGVKKVGISRGHSTEVMVSAGKTGLEGSWQARKCPSPHPHSPEPNKALVQPPFSYTGPSPVSSTCCFCSASRCQWHWL
uniref:Ig-like domain-containing protein n=1 Tax=Zonotrichia albicollis TaxID=44394 RepID=A0A8D2QHP3_ZONAL